MKKHLFLFFGIGLSMLLLAACSQAPRRNLSQLNLGTATGTVKLDGTPLAGAEVRFLDEEKHTSSIGVTDENGFYKLMFDTLTPGVLPGKKKVIIGTATQRGDSSEEDDPEREGVARASKERVAAKFNKNSDVYVTIEPNKSQTFDFDVTSQ